MDCRTFRKKHVAFVDDTLPGIEIVAMQRHLIECASCARQDTQVRRALLLFRNIPQIEPSADFSAGLQRRLREEQGRMASSRDRAFTTSSHGPGLRTFIAAAASIIVVGYLALYLNGAAEPVHEVALAPVVATEPELPPIEVTPPLATPALVASVSAGVPLWPAMLLADQAPVRFASEQFAR
jgi:hypothetical protein